MPCLPNKRANFIFILDFNKWKVLGLGVMTLFTHPCLDIVLQDYNEIPKMCFQQKYKWEGLTGPDKASKFWFCVHFSYLWDCVGRISCRSFSLWHLQKESDQLSPCESALELLPISGSHDSFWLPVQEICNSLRISSSWWSPNPWIIHKVWYTALFL